MTTAAQPLTQKQSEMLRFIKFFIDERHYPPTYGEIKTSMNLSTKSLVAYHLTALERGGYIRRQPNKARAIWLI